MKTRYKEITSGIFQVGGSGLTDAEDAAVYLIRFGHSGALVDAGYGRRTEDLLENIRQIGFDPAGIDIRASNFEFCPPPMGNFPKPSAAAGETPIPLRPKQPRQVRYRRPWLD